MTQRLTLHGPSRVKCLTDEPWDIIINPILDNSWYGGFKSLEFVPATRVAYNLNPKWAVAIEAGVGFGLTPATDKMTLKLMLSKDLNSKKDTHRTPKPPQ